MTVRFNPVSKVRRKTAVCPTDLQVYDLPISPSDEFCLHISDWHIIEQVGKLPTGFKLPPLRCIEGFQRANTMIEKIKNQQPQS